MFKAIYIKANAENTNSAKKAGGESNTTPPVPKQFRGNSGFTKAKKKLLEITPMIE